MSLITNSLNPYLPHAVASAAITTDLSFPMQLEKITHLILPFLAGPSFYKENQAPAIFERFVPPEKPLIKQKFIAAYWKKEAWKFVMGKTNDYLPGRYNPGWMGSDTYQSLYGMEDSSKDEKKHKSSDELDENSLKRKPEENPDLILSKSKKAKTDKPNILDLSHRNPWNFLKSLKKHKGPISENLIDQLKGVVSPKTPSEVPSLKELAMREVAEKIVEVLEKKNSPLDLIKIAINMGNIGLAIDLFMNNLDILDEMATTNPEEIRDLLIAANAHGTNIAHLAARTGKIKLLYYITNHPSQAIRNLLTARDVNEVNIAHIAARTGQIAVLDWIDSHPILAVRNLLAAPGNGQNMAHHAAETGQVEVLNWIDYHSDEAIVTLLTTIDLNGRNIAHIAAHRVQVGVLDWIENHPIPSIKNLPMQMEQTDPNI